MSLHGIPGSCRWRYVATPAPGKTEWEADEEHQLLLCFEGANGSHMRLWKEAILVPERKEEE